jgi:uncharacterized DUF497 family protein
MSLTFEWDKNKAGVNFKKHRVSFEEAVTVFEDPLAFIFYDADHSITEHREIIVGNSIAQRLLVVCFTERAESVIRIFSARLTTKQERNDYETNTRY